MNILLSGMFYNILEVGISSNKYSKALLNTVLGMGIVFTVLIFISGLIYLIKYIPIILNKFTNQSNTDEKVKLTTPLEQTFEPILSEESEELVGDTELVAVITAAIMASMGDEAPHDGLIVRSIRRVRRNQLQNA